jgi:hypothetical protein
MIQSLGFLFIALALQAEPDQPADFSRYQPILDRKPFGEIAAAGASAEGGAANNPDQPALSAALRLVALEMGEQKGTGRAGLVEASGKKTYFLSLGEEEDGIKLVDADFQGDRALIRKGGQEEWLSMNRGFTTPGASPADTSGEIARRQRFREMAKARMSQRNASPPAPQPVISSSLATNHPHFKNNEEMNEYYRKINLDLIRAGGNKGPPLPIPLTPEDDAALVNEGVLPPAEAPPK